MFLKAKISDIQKIQSLAKLSWQSTYKDILSSEQIDYMLELMYSNDAIKIHLENPNFHYYLIKENDEFSGFVGFEFNNQPDITKLHRIYFLKEAQGKGLGKKALEFVKDKAKEFGDKKLILTVNKNNSAQKFYESQGFKIYDEAIFDIGNGYVMDDYLMEFVL